MEGFLALIEALCTGDNGWIPGIWRSVSASRPQCGALSVTATRGAPGCGGRDGSCSSPSCRMRLSLNGNCALIYTMRAGLSVWLLTLEVFPLHLGAILVGFEAYVVSVMQQGRYVRRHGAPHLVVWTADDACALCGRDLSGEVPTLQQLGFAHGSGPGTPSAIVVMTASRPLVVIGATFVLLTLFYWV